MTRIIFATALALTLSACGGQFSNPFEGLGAQNEPSAGKPLDGADAARPKEPSVVEVGGTGQSAASLDKTTEAEKKAATAAPAGGAVLGTTVASLGDPTEQGFWLRTPLVSAEAQGSVKTQGGAVVQVKLIPIDGPPSAGSRISLAAMRALNIGLTELATLTVSRS
ncbi:hypothetical protein [Litoreibacter arenae]|uniref:D-galactarate dehydratase n=1 Tax=Litoreibacter arenae DSM 19593 TaxID=1123360 RepID=S9QJB0_9RHOB|nr:hypothetical protein [Litoreibacter arenae]EPX79902.1 hypothetical protein thalar_01238 [Litoreibacter arenae DSM 19593]